MFANNFEKTAVDLERYRKAVSSVLQNNSKTKTINRLEDMGTRSFKRRLKHLGKPGARYQIHSEIRQETAKRLRQDLK